MQQSEHNKLLVRIPQFSLTCVLQESLYFGVKRLEGEETLVQITIEKRKHEEVFEFHERFPVVRILEAQNYSIFIRMQWQERMQASRIPFAELLMGFTQGVVMERCFNQCDLIRVCSSVVESVSLNWRSMSLLQLIPLEYGPYSRQAMKMNSSITLQHILQFQRNNLVLLYRGVLMTSALIAIFLKGSADYILVLVQRLDTGHKLVKKLKYDHLENQLPGFHQLLNKGFHQDLGRRLFKVLKNKMILECFYNF